MKLTRRQFFAGLLATGAVAAVPFRAVADFTIDWTVRNVRWTGKNESTPYTALDLLRYLMEKAEEDAESVPLPAARDTDQIIKLNVIARH